MKKVLLFIFTVFTIASTTVKSQNIYLSDTVWKGILINKGLGSCIVGDSLDTQCPDIANVYSLGILSYNLSRIDGLEYFNNLDSLNFQTAGLQFMSGFPPALRSFSLYSFSFSQDNWPAFPSTLSALRATNTPVTSLPSLPSTMQILELKDCGLTGNISLPADLIEFIASGNSISSIVSLPINLVKLDIFGSDLTSLPALPSGLEELNCQGNQITALPPLPNSLKFLNAVSNNLTAVPAFGGNLEQILLDFNQITTIPALPPTIRVFEVSGNLLTDLPVLPDNMEILHFSNNLISVVDSFPDSLKIISGVTNLLSSLPEIPSQCLTLQMDNNSLTSIPELPHSLNILSLTNNNIVSMENIPDSMSMFFIAFNPIACLPPFTSVFQIGIENTNIRCLPNLIHSSMADVDLDTFPLCQPSSGCDINWSIAGNVFHDLNTNCLYDSTEDLMNTIPVVLDSSGTILQIFYTDQNGNYSFRAPIGTYSVYVDTDQVPFISNCTTPNNVSLTLTDSLVDSLNIGLLCDTVNDLVVHSVNAHFAFIPGRLTGIAINAGNEGDRFGTNCYSGSGTLYAILSGNVSFFGPAGTSIAPDQIIGDSLIWNIPDLSLIDPVHDFNIILITDTTAVIGDTICITVILLPDSDIDPSNNTLTVCFPVRTSFDPNEKWMTPEIADTSVHQFSFQVNFQNTGNASAENIFIIDTLDLDLDIESFEFLSSSHDVVTQVLPGNILRFNFHSINLPDSNSNEMESHGFVSFRLNRKSGTGVGTEISNTAYIYFDYNAPIVTNTVALTIESTVGISALNPISQQLKVYPNPVHTELNVGLKHSSKMKTGIYDILGKMHSIPVIPMADTFKINVDQLENGIYILVVEKDGELYRGKFIKN